MTGGDRPQSGHETRTHEVDECPRCGVDHGEVTFHRIDEPIEGPAGEYPWWWLCEEAKAPVLAQLSWEEC